MDGLVHELIPKKVRFPDGRVPGEPNVSKMPRAGELDTTGRRDADGNTSYAGLEPAKAGQRQAGGFPARAARRFRTRGSMVPVLETPADRS